MYQSAAQAFAPASPPRTSLRMKVRIKQWNAVAAWRWDMPDDDLCGICRSPYDSTCSKCKFPGDGCPLLMGQCNHSFHMHCIEDWLKQEASQEKCPMCRQPFTVKDANTSMTEA